MQHCRAQGSRKPPAKSHKQPRVARLELASTVLKTAALPLGDTLAGKLRGLGIAPRCAGYEPARDLAPPPCYVTRWGESKPPVSGVPSWLALSPQLREELALVQLAQPSSPARITTLEAVNQMR